MPKLTDLVSMPAGINKGLKGSNNTLMLALLGNPHDSYSRDCKPPTKPFKKRVVTKDVGPFRVTGFDLAVASLKDVMADIEDQQPRIYSGLDTAGMLCCRFVRGSASVISNHSWGCAVDIKIDGVLDRPGNDKVHFGLTLIAPIFNAHGWYWGAGFPREDAMHFEVSRKKIKHWHRKGLLPAPRKRPVPPASLLQLGDRGNSVLKLQKQLNRLGASLETDGIFGPATRAAVINFQARHGLVPDGIVGKRTHAKLRKLT